ncbi:efflux RND transporter periplasmic adaptor subunit [Pseudoalteromonas piscicida]|uniref:efflux RND transporter periplasmic adaptor subunit n=1 Tax=Pseudoalteromonas piscicida TaxID=43662 RepID=UPI000E360B3C|nr:efflux RND transporter periplasmic adaptor subunit [Pseudoalteromonas piscicida]AXQ99551.1 efflux RND transporter periplasmic adaptor subunit [Pseudoalteromonas piscicida]
MKKVVLALLLFMFVTDAKSKDYPVEVRQVISNKQAYYSSYITEVESNQEVDISPENTGIVEFILDYGDEFKKGAVLVKINTVELESALREVEAELDILKVDFEHQRELYQFKKNLYDSKSISRNDYLEQRNSYKLSEIKIEKYNAKKQTIKSKISKSTITALFDGVFVDRYINEGELAIKGVSIAKVVGNERLISKVKIPIHKYDQVRDKEGILVKFGKDEYKAKVKSLINVVEKKTQTFELIVDMTDSGFLIGSFVKAYIEERNPKYKFLVPRDSIVHRKEGNFIYLVDENSKAKRVTVSLGNYYGDNVEVSGEIAVNDKVVINGSEKIYPGSTLKLWN